MSGLILVPTALLALLARPRADGRSALRWSASRSGLGDAIRTGRKLTSSSSASEGPESAAARIMGSFWCGLVGEGGETYLLSFPLLMSFFTRTDPK